MDAMQLVTEKSCQARVLSGGFAPTHVLCWLLSRCNPAGAGSHRPVDIWAAHSSGAEISGVAIIYIISGLVGSLASANLSTHYTAVGAPAAVCGLIGELQPLMGISCTWTSPVLERSHGVLMHCAHTHV